MQKKDVSCINCLNNPEFVEPSVKRVKVTLEIDQDLEISDCELCQLIREKLCSDFINESLLLHG